MVESMPTLTKRKKRVHGDEGIDPFFVMFMALFMFMIVFVIPFITWTNGMVKTMEGVNALTQQASRSGATQVKPVIDPVTGNTVLRIDEASARSAAINYYNIQRSVVKDYFGFSLLTAPVGKTAPSDGLGSFNGTGCVQSDPAGCIRFAFVARDYYDGTLFSTHLLPEFVVRGEGQAELSVGAELCDFDQVTRLCRT
jgi:hypothetical protein